jgi:hypothetical protein
MKERKFDLGDRLIDFSMSVIDVVEALPDSRVGNHIADQLLRAETLAALREADVWLKIIKRKRLLEQVELLEKISAECRELIAIFASGIATTGRNMQTRQGEHPGQVEHSTSIIQQRTMKLGSHADNFSS